jgi:hypothetical protein
MTPANEEEMSKTREKTCELFEKWEESWYPKYWLAFVLLGFPAPADHRLKSLISQHAEAIDAAIKLGSKRTKQQGINSTSNANSSVIHHGNVTAGVNTNGVAHIINHNIHFPDLLAAAKKNDTVTEPTVSAMQAEINSLKESLEVINTYGADDETMIDERRGLVRQLLDAQSRLRNHLSAAHLSDGGGSSRARLIPTAYPTPVQARAVVTTTDLQSGSKRKRTNFVDLDVESSASNSDDEFPDYA